MTPAKLTPTRQHQCTRCGEWLHSNRVTWLELDKRSGLYWPTDGQVGPENSQGWFPFGTACAKTQIFNQAKAR